MLKLLCLVLCLWAGGAMAGADVLVQTPKGLIEGIEMDSRGGRPYYAFSGIPYAKPPVGKRRFQPPVPVDPWNGTFQATEELDFCLQVPIYDPFLRNTSRGSEDCLQLNVYTPNVKGKLPVMVYIHGGGWRSSAPGIGPTTRGKYLMDEDIVLVAPNYRVGVLGFLSTEDNVISGNFGLKDQTAALKWIQENIKYFGGDPKKVTVFGESAGGASTNYLLLSPASRDLVTQGISQSGVAQGLWTISPPGVAKYRAHKLARLVGCPAQPHTAMLNCLRTKSAQQLIETDIKLNRDDYNPTIMYQPVIESKDVAKPFLRDSPYNMVNTDKPWIAGFNSGEGAFKVISYKVEPKLLESFKKNMDELLPESIMYANTTSQVGNVTRMLKERYHLTGNKIMSGINDMFLDLFFLWPMVTSSRTTKAPMYSYLFDHRGKTSATDILTEDTGVNVGNLGVSHTDELLYLFNFEDEVPDMMTAEDTKVSKRLVKLWTTFAKHGVPTLPEDKVKWTQYSSENPNYLRITTKESKMETGFRKGAVDYLLSTPLRDKMEKMKL